MNKIPCYICHYTKLTYRRKHMEEQIQKFKLNEIFDIKWLTDFDREQITPQQYKEYIGDNMKNINTGIKANGIAHIYALKDISKNHEFGLIIEDDLVLKPDFKCKFIEMISSLPSPWDMIYLSEGCNLHPKNISKDKTLYESLTSRCANCYLVSKNATKKILSTCIPIQDAIDWQYNHEQKKHNLKYYWLEPTLAYEGSDYGLFNSSLR